MLMQPVSKGDAMKRATVLFGASNFGKYVAGIIARSSNDILFCDNNPNLPSEVDGIRTITPAQLFDEYSDSRIIITSNYYKEISRQLYENGILNFEIARFDIEGSCGVLRYNSGVIMGLPEVRLIDTGAFLSDLKLPIVLPDRTFLLGSSSIVDFMVMQALAVKFSRKNYLEIGSFVGESLTAVCDHVETCVSLSIDAGDMFELIDMDNFTSFFSKKKKNIIHHQCDSKQFDYSSLNTVPDFVFIDGDHSYNGVFTDTKNIFSIIDPSEAIVVWHDFMSAGNQIGEELARGLYGAVDERFHEDIFAFDNDCVLGAVYLPKKFQEGLVFSKKANSAHPQPKRSEIISYDVQVSTIRKSRKD